MIEANRFITALEVFLCIFLIGLQDSFAQPLNKSEELPQDLSQVSLDKLLNFDLVVTLPGRREQRVSQAAAAVYVLTDEDIRRSGATHVAEVLRLVPGVNVARISSNKWAISIRGFNQIFANKLLVLIDGVSVFSPTTNGVYWESNELDLDDIDRIEVVRGPGGALWGSNAVNGVINIVTKSSEETKGAKVVLGGGTHERDFLKLRYGGSLGEDTNYRIYGSGNRRTENRLSASDDGSEDDWDSYTAGFRVDSALSSNDQLTVSSQNGYQSDFFVAAPPALDPPYVDTENYAGNGEYRDFRTMARWVRDNHNDSRLDSQISYSEKRRESRVATFEYDILNLEVQHNVRLLENHNLVYGGGYRYFYNKTEDSPAQEVDPSTRSTDLFSAFLQDEYTLIPKRLNLIAGTKFEHTDQTGLEYMPNARMLWNATEDTIFWTAVSKAVAPPAVFFEDSVIPVAAFPTEQEGLSSVVTVNGNRDLSSESLVAYEVGGRSSLTSYLSLDVSLFYNRYDNIFSAEPGTPQIGNSRLGNRNALLIPLNLSNDLSADSYGGELASEIKLTDDWRVTSWYSFLQIDVHKGNSLDTGNQDLIENGSPQHQVGLRSLLTFFNDWEFDGSVRYIDKVPYSGISEYVELDLRLAYKLLDNVELSLVGQNLLNPAHQEGSGNFFGPPPTKIERGYYALLRMTF